MKKKLLSLAVVSALGSAGIAQAVHVNPDGLGQVLIYPFYTVEGGSDTYVSVTNTTSATKAVKVRFLEAMNSQEVLDFNLYLSPKDIWTAVITDNPDGDGAIMRTTDTSCTVPAIPAAGVPFRETQYQADSVNGVDRTREGYAELIEMGEIVDPTVAALIKHGVDGVPADCAAVRGLWQSGPWATNPSFGMAAPGGGLYGYGVLINVDAGTDATYDSTALDNFLNFPLHTFPGSLAPSLNDGVTFADIIDGNQVIAADFNTGIDAVSSLFMHDSIANDYVLAPEIAASTDWVINFPTKRFYTNLVFTNGVSTFRAPFTAGWNRNTSRACEPFGIVYYDREERREEGELDFSPLPPAQVSSLCWEANVVTFNDSDVLASQRVRTNLEVLFDNGWAEFDFDNVSGRQLVDNFGTVFNGLPVTGFAVQNYVNGDVGGLLSNYSGLINHKATRNIFFGLD